jgi:Fic family protein
LVDGNGRIHRFIVHDVLARMNYTEQGMIFPVSSSILSHIKDYQKALSAYSSPILDFIEWETAPDKNVNVLNETIDLYRFFDATQQAEFLYECVKDTIENIIPQEVDYLRKYDEFKLFIDESFEMPDNMVSLLVSFLEQGNGTLSNRAIKKEFSMLSEAEIKRIENEFKTIFTID